MREDEFGMWIWEWQWSCRLFCPWDYDFWMNSYQMFGWSFEKADCSFFDQCEPEMWEEEPTATTTPEPASLILMGTGLAGLYAARRRRKKR